jgi:hypothetical protein
MRVRVIDYVGNYGGGVRFSAEVLRVLTCKYPDVGFELVSYGSCLERYKDLFRSAGVCVPVIPLRPRRAWLNVRNHRVLTGRWGTIVKRMLNPVTKWGYEVPAEAFLGCDRVWMPWIHWHETGEAPLDRVVGSFHDAIIFDVAGIFPPRVVAQERRNIASWLVSDAQIVVSSHATAKRLLALFSADSSRLHVVRLSGDHALTPGAVVPEAAFPWISRPYLLSPANITKHKNHEVLFEGVAMWGKKHPLVLTGEGSNMGFGRRAWHLRRHANRLGLEPGTSLHPLGYVPDGLFRAILGRAWALVIASRAEGGGSFPVWEALANGIPVVCAESTAVKEHLEWLGAEVLWFDPDSPKELADRLIELGSGYEHFKARAMTQRARLRTRTWEDVATDYWELLTGGIV